MKTITNEDTSIKSGDATMHRGQLLRLVANGPAERGISISDMRARMRILDVIEAADQGDIILEDADFTLLKKLYEGFGWTYPHKDLLKLADHLDELAKPK